MAEHTLGPWTAKIQRNKHREDLGWIIEHDGGRIGWASLSYTQTNSEADAADPAREANARLMASAPDLLDAVKALMKEYDTKDEVLPAHYQALAAIAKAEGRT